MCYLSKQVNIKYTCNPEQEKWRTAVYHMLIQLWGVNNSKVGAKVTELTLISEMLLFHCVGAFSTHGSRGLIASIPARPCETGAIPHFQHAALTTPSSHGPLLPQRSFPGVMLPTAQHLLGGDKCPWLWVTQVQAEGTPSLVGGGACALAKVCYLNRRPCCRFCDTCE